MKTKKVLSLLAIIVIIITLIISAAGCGKTPQESDVEKSSAKQDNEKSEADVEQVMRYAFSAAPGSMEPITTNELYSFYIVRQIYNGLTDRTPEGGLLPGLAEKWETKDGGKTYHFNLKEGVKFHSGKELTSKDVKYTFEAILTPAKKGGFGVEFLTNIVGAKEMLDGKATELKGFKALGDYEFEIELTEPDVLFPNYCSVECLYIVDGEAAEGQGDNWWEKLSAGTGPFKLKSYERDKKIVLVANEEYWRGRPQIDTLEIHIVPSEDTALSMYESGQLDMCDVPFQQLERIKADAKLSKELQYTPIAQLMYLGFNQNLYAPFKDVRVREAINLVIDRKNMVKSIMADAAFPLYGVIPVGFACYDKNIAEIPYDPEMARQLLEQAGYNKNKPLPPVTISTSAKSQDIASYIQSQLKRELGMKVEVETPERAKVLADLRGQKIPLFIWGCTADYGDAKTIISTVFSPTGSMNFSQYDNKEFNQLMEKAANETNAGERNKAYLEAERTIMADWGCAPLYNKKAYLLIKPYVKDVPLSTLGLDTFEPVKIQH